MHTLPSKINMNQSLNCLMKNVDNFESVRRILSKILFNSYLWTNKVEFGKEALIEREKVKSHRVHQWDSIPISLRTYKNIDFNGDHVTSKEKVLQKIRDLKPVNFPLGYANRKLELLNDCPDEMEQKVINLQEELEGRRKLMLQKSKTEPPVDYKQWLSDYEEYDEAQPNTVNSSWTYEYGTPDPQSEISKVPCGGCGALFHCQDQSLPGYIPSEIFKHTSNLGAIECQRCHFLKTYNVALKVQVSNNDYIALLEKIQIKNSLIVLIIDLTDFPCSIWPNFIDVIGLDKPLVVVGNKVDLLPRDSPDFLRNVKNVLYDVTMQCANLPPKNIKSVNLVSAKTGFGVESLITELYNVRNPKDDIYLIGCTNAGKSTLFNTLINSDLCKVQAVDIIKRATTSVWPGTTLNLLKFPILKPSGWRNFLRNKRLSEQKKYQEFLRGTNSKQPAVEHVGRTFRLSVDPKLKITDKTPFLMDKLVKPAKIGLIENQEEFKYGSWCHDTPGVVHNDQILNMLTTQELMLTVPRERIVPRSFTMWPETSLFIAGLARVDFIRGRLKIKLTVFCSNNLPITVCQLADADEMYTNLIGSELFLVPTGEPQRLKQWPNLEPHPTDFTLEGIPGFMADKSCGDIVLSNAGWVSVTCYPKNEAVLRAWTPQRKGVYLRRSILPQAINLRGKRIRETPAYFTHKINKVNT